MKQYDDNLRYPVVLLDVGQTLVGPRESYGAVYSEALRGLGPELAAERLEESIQEVAAEMKTLVPAGADRFSHFPGGENEYWLRFSREVIARAAGREISMELARVALDRLREAFKSDGAWIVYPDVVPALEGLRARGCRLGVVSNWDSRLPLVLERLGLHRHFDTVGVSHIEKIEKPDPRFFLRVLQRLDARPEQALHIGDSVELDLEGARAAGVDGLIVDRTDGAEAGPSVLTDLAELPRIVGSNRRS